MSREYAMSRVRDALEKSGGNHLKAQRLITTWIEKDHSLLFGLVGPHLQGIISHAVNHAAAPERKDPPRALNIEEEAAGEFGAALVQGMRGTPAADFGQPATRNVGKPGQASQSHIDAINRIATKKED